MILQINQYVGENMDLKKYYEKNIIIIEEGTMFNGFVDEYIYPEDNENGKRDYCINSNARIS